MSLANKTEVDVFIKDGENDAISGKAEIEWHLDIDHEKDFVNINIYVDDQEIEVTHQKLDDEGNDIDVKDKFKVRSARCDLAVVPSQTTMQIRPKEISYWNKSWTVEFAKGEE